MSVAVTWFPLDRKSAARRRVDELRSLVRHDPRFGWTTLTGSSSSSHILVRRSSNAMCVEDSHTYIAEIEEETLPQHVWPAAPRMCEWIATHSSFFAGKTVLELGAGTGYVGFAVSSVAARVVLTDTSLISLALMEETLATGAFANCSCAQLQWGRLDHLTVLKQNCQIDAFDVVIGSDTFYFDQSFTLGLSTARAALLPTREGNVAGSFIYGSVARSCRMEVDLYCRPIEYGFDTRLLLNDCGFLLFEWTLPIPGK